jgi:hypothetical protein
MRLPEKRCHAVGDEVVAQSSLTIETCHIKTHKCAQKDRQIGLRDGLTVEVHLLMSMSGLGQRAV